MALRHKDSRLFVAGSNDSNPLVSTGLKDRIYVSSAQSEETFHTLLLQNFGDQSAPINFSHLLAFLYL
jgi:hypothetical protein